jgi:hypothetical protein
MYKIASICVAGVLITLTASHLQHFNKCLSDVLNSSDLFSGQPNRDIFSNGIASCARFNSFSEPAWLLKALNQS